VRFEIGIANPARGNGGDASTKKERAAIMRVAERHILSVGNLTGSPGSERLRHLYGNSQYPPAPSQSQGHGLAAAESAAVSSKKYSIVAHCH